MSTNNKAKTILASKLPTSPRSVPRLHADKHLLLDLDGVCMTYGNEVVLDSVSFCIHSGEFIGLIGPNGAGKTTLLTVLLGLQMPQAGSVSRAMDVRIGYVPQRLALQGGQVPLSVMELVRLGSGGDTNKAMDALREVRLEDTVQARFDELSGGQQQRVYIAKALASKPDILVLDEPTTGIDDPSQVEFYALASQLHAHGISIIMVSHDVTMVLQQVTRVMCLNRQLLFDGPPDQFETDKYLPSFYAARHRVLHHQHQGASHA